MIVVFHVVIMVWRLFVDIIGTEQFKHSSNLVRIRTQMNKGIYILKKESVKHIVGKTVERAAMYAWRDRERISEIFANFFLQTENFEVTEATPFANFGRSVAHHWIPQLFGFKKHAKCGH